MKLLMCAMYDSKIEAFNRPVFFRTRGEAMRSFIDACGREKEFVAHPEDYTFFEIGVFDDENGHLLNYDNKVVVMTATDAARINNREKAPVVVDVSRDQV